jgi:hypothetical protein
MKPHALAWARRHADALVVVLIIAGLQGATLWSNERTRAAQQQQGQVIEARLCATLGRLAGLQPPAGNPAHNPSRAYLQDLHHTLAELGTDLGCPQGGTR